jgi:ankyrin repeat protein
VSEIFEAIVAGDDERARALAEADPAAVHSRNEEGTSALLLARYYGRVDLVEELAARAPELDVFEAAALGRLERVQELVAADGGLAGAFAPDGFHPLGLAAFFNHPEVVRFLLERGADVDAVARNARVQTTALQAAAASGDVASARLLLDAGADVNAAQPGGFRPLHSAAANGSDELAGLLLERGADRAARTDAGATAADLARDAGHAALAAKLDVAAGATTRA